MSKNFGREDGNCSLDYDNKTNDKTTESLKKWVGIGWTTTEWKVGEILVSFKIFKNREISTTLNLNKQYF